MQSKIKVYESAKENTKSELPPELQAMVDGDKNKYVIGAFCSFSRILITGSVYLPVEVVRIGKTEVCQCVDT